MSELTREELVKEIIYDVATVGGFVNTQSAGEELAEIIYDAIWEHIKEDL